jgi:enoyl-CoA hydratase
MTTTYQLNEKVATITIDDGKVNALSLTMLQSINAGLDQAQADKAAVVIAGRSGMFSAGFDLSVFKSDPSALFLMLEAGAKLTHRLLSFPTPVVAACTGHAVAMGAFLLLSTDIRIGPSEGARVHINEVQIGMTLPHFAIEISRQRLTAQHFNIATISAEPFNPQQALAAGFFDELATNQTVVEVAQARAARLAKLDMPAFHATKLRARKTTLDALAVAIQMDVADWKNRFVSKA